MYVRHNMYNQEIIECIWEGKVSHKSTYASDIVTLACVNQMVTPISNLKYRVTLVGDDGNEIHPCKYCLEKGVTCTSMFRRLIMKPTKGEHPILEFDIMIVCDGTETHTDKRSARLFVEIYSQ